ncbi:hypothetical protein ACFX12_037240 [Malus domestica]
MDKCFQSKIKASHAALARGLSRDLMPSPRSHHLPPVEKAYDTSRIVFSIKRLHFLKKKTEIAVREARATTAILSLRMGSSSARQFGSRLDLKSSPRTALTTLATQTLSMLKASWLSGLSRLCSWDSLNDTELVDDHSLKDLTHFTQEVPLIHSAVGNSMAWHGRKGLAIFGCCS